MNLKKIAFGPVLTVDVSDHCRRAAEIMSEFHIRHLPVLREARPVGMVSDRDLLSAIGRWTDRPDDANTAVTDWADRLPVEEIMSTPLVCLSPDDSLEKAARLMLNKKISAVPLASHKGILGIVTETDLLAIITGEQPWQRQKVVEQMTANVFRVAPEAPIHAAWRLMRDKQIRHLVVAQGDTLLGIISDRDVFAGITWHGPRGIQDRVQHIMSQQVVTVESQATLADAASQMRDRKIGALPVCDGQRLIGIITETDLLRVFVTSSNE